MGGWVVVLESEHQGIRSFFEATWRELRPVSRKRHKALGNFSYVTLFFFLLLLGILFAFGWFVIYTRFLDITLLWF